MEEDAKIAAQKSGRLSFYVVNAIADGCTPTGAFFMAFFFISLTEITSLSGCSFQFLSDESPSPASNRKSTWS